MATSNRSDRTGRLTEWARSHAAALSVGCHLLLFAFAWLMAFGLVYNFRFFHPDRWVTVLFLPLLPLVVLAKMMVFGALGLFRGSWRHVGLRDLLSVALGAWWGFFAIWSIYYGMVYAQRFGIDIDPFGEAHLPDSVFLLDFAGTIALVCGARLAFRLYHEEIRPESAGTLPRLLILGAGDCGANVLREIQRMPLLQYQVVGFLDDDAARQRARIHGTDVLGPISDIKEIGLEHNIDEILIAMPSATKKQIRRVVDLCQGTNLRFKTVPALGDLIAGTVSVSQFRDVEINDLLGRAPVAMDSTVIGDFIASRVVVVTGAGGSIGSEMCRQIAAFAPQRLILVEQAEQNLFEIDCELIAAYPDVRVVPYICDICDRQRVARIFSTEKPSIVYHAAAHKHVPMMESNAGEAIKNNVLGTRTIADAAVEHGCEKFVMISTDKAVNPTSVMGASKRVAEMYIQGLNRRAETQFVTVRFGNVLGSSGSVVPIFKKQIAEDGPVCVTHADMTRYFMTITEAAQLVLQAGFMGRGGEIFVLDMGEPVKILDLAKDLITLSGFRPYDDIDIKIVGMRPGEKLYEELSIEGENVSRTDHPKIGIWMNRPEDWDLLLASIDDLLAKANEMTREQARAALKNVVPEFQFESPRAPRSPNADSSPATSGGPSVADVAAAPG